MYHPIVNFKIIQNVQIFNAIIYLHVECLSLKSKQLTRDGHGERTVIIQFSLRLLKIQFNAAGETFHFIFADVTATFI